jgi:hypothetical protein
VDLQVSGPTTTITTGMFSSAQGGFVTDDLTLAALATWAARHLPARLDVEATAKLLGFAVSDIQVLMASGKLMPLGDPAPNAPKWFAAVEMIRLAADQEWLREATKDVAKYWRQKREHCKKLLPSLRA